MTVGVTGTNGKTSTTMLIASCMKAAGHLVASETTIGYEYDGQKQESSGKLGGFYDALRQAAERGCRHAAIEVTSEALAQGYAKRWRFDVGVFTNLTRDHFESHRTGEHYLASKAQLFVHLGPGRTAVLNACDPSATLIDRVTPPDVLRIWYAVASRGTLLCAADLAATQVEVSSEGTCIKLAPGPLAETLGGELRTRLIGEIFAENVLAAAAASLAAGLPGPQVAEGLAHFPGVPGRFEVIGRSPLVAVDFAHTPDALARTCDTARKLAGSKRVLIVFGAGGKFDPPKRGPMGRAVGERADEALITTDNPRDDDPRDIARAVAAGCRQGGRARVRLEPDRRKAIEIALSEARPGDVVVIAGRGHETEQVIGTQRIPFSDVDVVRELIGASRVP